MCSAVRIKCQKCLIFPMQLKEEREYFPVKQQQPFDRNMVILTGTVYSGRPSCTCVRRALAFAVHPGRSPDSSPGAQHSWGIGSSAPTASASWGACPGMGVGEVLTEAHTILGSPKISTKKGLSQQDHLKQETTAIQSPPRLSRYSPRLRSSVRPFRPSEGCSLH